MEKRPEISACWSEVSIYMASICVVPVTGRLIIPNGHTKLIEPSAPPCDHGEGVDIVQPEEYFARGSMSSSLFCAEMVTYSPGYPAKSDVKSVGGRPIW